MQTFDPHRSPQHSSRPRARRRRSHRILPRGTCQAECLTLVRELAAIADRLDSLARLQDELEQRGEASATRNIRRRLDLAIGMFASARTLS
jgi:hypothetical protein